MVHMCTGDMLFLKLQYTKCLLINYINPAYLVIEIHPVTSTLLLICQSLKVHSHGLHISLVKRYHQSN